MNIAHLSKQEQQHILDGTKIEWYPERVNAWLRGERIAPVTIDMALTQACNYKCIYCYGQLQENEKTSLSWKNIKEFLEDASLIGVQGVTLVSDGESSIHPNFIQTIEYGTNVCGLAMGCGTNGYLIDKRTSRRIIPYLSYLRFNMSAGESKRYAEIMGSPEGSFERVSDHIVDALGVRASCKSNCTIGIQMVLMPEFADQVLPLAKHAKALGVDYFQIKHCSDDEYGNLGVKYEEYKKLEEILKEAEALSGSSFLVKVKWTKIRDANIRSYQQCYGPPFLLQVSGSGLVAPCGMLFNSRYREYHMGNLTRERFRNIFEGDTYWKVLRKLASKDFNAQKMCGTLCLQHSVNKYLSFLRKNKITHVIGSKTPINHKEFI